MSARRRRSRDELRNLLDTRLLLTVEEVAQLCAIDRATAYRQLIATGEIPIVKIGASSRVPAPWLRDWIEKRTRAALDSAQHDAAASATRRRTRRSAGAS